MLVRICTSIILCALIAGACFPANDQEQIKQNLSTHSYINSTSHPSTLNPSPTLSLENTTVTPNLHEAARQYYRAMLLVEIYAQFISGTANQTVSGDLQGFDHIVAIQEITELLEESVVFAPDIPPPDSLAEEWKAMLDLHYQIKEIVRLWSSDQIDSALVIDSVSPLILQVDTLLVKVEEKLSEEFNFDTYEVSTEREFIRGLLFPIPDTLE